MSIRNTTKRKLLASAGTTVMISVVASGAFAADTKIPDMATATASGHKTAVAVVSNTGGIEAEISNAHGGVTVTGTQAGTSNTVTANTISAGATANEFSNKIDLSLIQEDEVDAVNNGGVAALGVATNTGVVKSLVESSSLSVDLTGFANGTAVNSDNTIRAQSTVNSGATSIAGTIPNGYASQTEGHSTTTFSSNPHAAEGSIVASSVQMNSETGHEAKADDNAIGLTLKSTLDNTVDSSPTLDRNTIDATMAVNSAASTIDLQRGGAPAFEGSAVVTNLQSNLGGSASASNLGSSIMATVTGTSGSVLNTLDGGLSVQGNTISSAASGNSSTGAAGVAGNRILIGDQLSVQGAKAADPGSTVAYGPLPGVTTADATADLVILNSQGNSGVDGPLTISSSTAGGVIGAQVDSLDGGTVTVTGNKVTSQASGNSASSAVLSGEGAAEFDASVALLSQQVNYFTNVAATTSNTVVTAVVGTAVDGMTNKSTVSVSGNRSAAAAYGNDVAQTIALEANTLNSDASLVNLTGGTTGATNDGNASATGAVTIANLQSSYHGNVTAANVNSVIGLDADTKVATPGDVIASSTLSTDKNTQEAVALGSSATNQIGKLTRDPLTGELTAPGLSANTVGGGAGIASVQIGDADSAVTATLSGASVGLIAGTHVEDDTLSVAGNLQRAIGYGTMGTNTLSVKANSVNVADGGDGASGTYNSSGDPFHQYSNPTVFTQPTVEASFGVLNDQSIQNAVTASAMGLTALGVEGDLSGSTATNDKNALVAAAYGNDAVNGIALDATTLTTNGPASVAHVGNAQAVFGEDAAVLARAFGGVKPPTNDPHVMEVIKTDIQRDVENSTISTSQNQVQALAVGSQASNSLGVSGNTIDTSGVTVPVGLSLSGDVLSTPTSFGVTNAQAGAGSVSASLLNDTDPKEATNSASVLTHIRGDIKGSPDGTIERSTVASDENVLSAQATSNSAVNALGIKANDVATSSGVMNFQVTSADVSARIGVAGLEYIAPEPFILNATVSYDDNTESDGTWTWAGGHYRISLGDPLLTSEVRWALEADGWSESGAYLQKAFEGGSITGVQPNTYQVSGTTGGQEATPNFGGVTIVADGASILGSTLSVDGNKVNGAVTGNSAANALSVEAGMIAGGSGLDISTASADGDLSTSADHSLLSQQFVDDGTLESSVAGSFGIATAEDTAISGSSLSVSGNGQRASSVANTAANTLSLTGNDVSAGSALLSAQGSDASVKASSNVEVFAPAAVSSSSVEISGNTNTALGVINDATNTSTVSATNITTLGAGATPGEVGNAVLGLNWDSDPGVEEVTSWTAEADHVLQNMQGATATVQSTAVTSLYNADGVATETSGLTASTFTMNGNVTYAEASANRAANTMTLDGSASQGASGGVFNLQTSEAAATANATTNAGLKLAGDATNPALFNSTVSLNNNSTTALAQGNSATNVLNSVAGANYGISTGVGGVQFAAADSSTVKATAAVLNVQTNSGDVKASSTGATYQVALNAGAGGPDVSNGTVSVGGNSVAAQAFGNNAVNKISLSGLNTGTPTAALGNVQTNSGAITASVTGGQVGISSIGGANGSSFGVGGNTISANAVGNSVSNTISRK
ncbi:hypothetical protein ATER59S_00976 [Aquamicrobium terrae]